MVDFLFYRLLASNKVFAFLGWSFFLLIYSCVSNSYLVKDQIGLSQIRDTALVSIYMNRQVYEVNSPPADVGGLELLNNDLLLGDQGDPLKLDQNHFSNLGQEKLIEKFSEQLISSLNRAKIDLRVWPISQYVSKEAFQQPIDQRYMTQVFDFGDRQKIKNRIYFGNKRLKLITFKEVVQQTISEDDLVVDDFIRLEDLGKFADQLGLGGIWIVEVDLAYKFFWKIDAQRSKVRASTSVKLMLIDRHGEILFETKDIVKGEGDRFEGELVEVKQTEDRLFELKEDHPIFDSYLTTFKENIRYYIDLLK